MCVCVCVIFYYIWYRSEVQSLLYPFIQFVFICTELCLLLCLIFTPVEVLWFLPFQLLHFLRSQGSEMHQEQWCRPGLVWGVSALHWEVAELCHLSLLQFVILLVHFLFGFLVSLRLHIVLLFPLLYLQAVDAPDRCSRCCIGQE